MNSRLVIDAIVRQSMALIARLSTASGVRSQLLRLLDEVFMSLVRELESQGLGKKVIADMLGAGLEAYNPAEDAHRELSRNKSSPVQTNSHQVASMNIRVCLVSQVTPALGCTTR